MKTAIIVISGLLIYFAVIYTAFNPKVLAPKIKPGQVWRYEYCPENPFYKSHFENYRVIKVNGDYVQYVGEKNDTMSDSKNTFVRNSTLSNPK